MRRLRVGRLGFGVFFATRRAQYNNFTQSTRAMTDLILILTTMPDDDRADALARTLVDERDAPVSPPGAGAQPATRPPPRGVVKTDQRKRNALRRRHEPHARPHDRHEPAEADRLPTVLLEDRVGSIEVRLVQQAGAALK